MPQSTLQATIYRLCWVLNLAICSESESLHDAHIWPQWWIESIVFTIYFQYKPHIRFRGKCLVVNDQSILTIIHRSSWNIFFAYIWVILGGQCWFIFRFHTWIICDFYVYFWFSFAILAFFRRLHQAASCCCCAISCAICVNSWWEPASACLKIAVIEKGK